MAIRTIVFSICMLAATVGSAQRLDQESLDFVIGSFEFALLHELSHLIMTEKNVPLLGPVEGTADYIATLILVSEDINASNRQETLNNFTRSAATAFGLSWRLSSQRGIDAPYWGTHSLGIQRYYSTLCLLYGSNPDANQDLVSDFGLPEQRAAGCQNEYTLANKGLIWLIDNFGATEEISIDDVVDYVYGDTDSQQQLQIVNRIRELNIFEQTVNAIVSELGISKQFTAAIRSCGSPQAAWQAEKRELVICYELLDAFHYVYSQRETGSNTN